MRTRICPKCGEVSLPCWERDIGGNSSDAGDWDDLEAWQCEECLAIFWMEGGDDD